MHVCACVCLLKNISSQVSCEAATITILVYKQIANELERIYHIDTMRRDQEVSIEIFMQITNIKIGKNQNIW